MVVYGEGRYLCAEHGVVRPGPRAEDDPDGRAVSSRRARPAGSRSTPGTVPEDAPLDPRNVYAASKTAQEHLAASWARAGGGTAVALRYHNVYGPHMPRDTPYAGVASLFRSALAARRGAAGVRGRRAAPRLRARARRRAGQPAGARCGRPRRRRSRAYNVASGMPHTVGDLARELAAACDGPAPVVTGRVPPRRRPARRGRAPSGPRAELGFTAQVVLRRRRARVRRRAPLRAPDVPDVVLPCLDEARGAALGARPACPPATGRSWPTTTRPTARPRSRAPHGAPRRAGPPARLRRGLPRRPARRRPPRTASSASSTPTARFDPRAAAAGRRAACSPAPPTWCSAAGADRPRRDWPLHARLGNARGRPPAAPGAPACDLHDLGPMRACRREALLRARPAGPPLRLPARDGHPGRRRRLAGRRGRRRLPAAHRPLEGHRHGRRHAQGGPRHVPRPARDPDRHPDGAVDPCTSPCRSSCWPSSPWPAG